MPGIGTRAAAWALGTRARATLGGRPTGIVILRARPRPGSPLTRITPVRFEGRSRGRRWIWFIYEIPSDRSTNKGRLTPPPGTDAVGRASPWMRGRSSSCASPSSSSNGCSSPTTGRGLGRVRVSLADHARRRGGSSRAGAREDHVIVAPAIWAGASLGELRVYLMVLSAVGLGVALAVWRPIIGMAASVAAFLFSFT